MTRKKGGKAAEYIGRALEMPPGTLTRTCNMQISGNREVLVDGCRGLIEYGDEKIRINAGNGTVQFCGRGLEIKSLSDTTAVIAGFILSVEFEM